MPRDQRLYMTFPIDFHRHPKISRLSLEARWTFVEMNGEARLAENDGRFTQEEAEYLWADADLGELVASHPTKPLVYRDGTDYVIRDYAEHQFTKADREALRAKRSAAGRKGGLAKSQASAKQALSKVKQTEAESESGIGDFYKTSKSQSSSNRARVSTDAIPITPALKRGAANQGIRNLRTVVDGVASIGLHVTAEQAYQLSLHLLEKAKTHPVDATAYVLTCVRNTPHEVAKYLHEIGVES